MPHRLSRPGLLPWLGRCHNAVARHNPQLVEGAGSESTVSGQPHRLNQAYPQAPATAPASSSGAEPSTPAIIKGSILSSHVSNQSSNCCLPGQPHSHAAAATRRIQKVQGQLLRATLQIHHLRQQHNPSAHLPIQPRSSACAAHPATSPSSMMLQGQQLSHVRGLQQQALQSQMKQLSLLNIYKVINYTSKDDSPPEGSIVKWVLDRAQGKAQLPAPAPEPKPLAAAPASRVGSTSAESVPTKEVPAKADAPSTPTPSPTITAPPPAAEAKLPAAATPAPSSASAPHHIPQQPSTSGVACPLEAPPPKPPAPAESPAGSGPTAPSTAAATAPAQPPNAAPKEPSAPSSQPPNLRSWALGLGVSPTAPKASTAAGAGSSPAAQPAAKSTAPKPTAKWQDLYQAQISHVGDKRAVKKRSDLQAMPQVFRPGLKRTPAAATATAVPAAAADAAMPSEPVASTAVPAPASAAEPAAQGVVAEAVAAPETSSSSSAAAAAATEAAGAGASGSAPAGAGMSGVRELFQREVQQAIGLPTSPVERALAQAMQKEQRTAASAAATRLPPRPASPPSPLAAPAASSGRPAAAGATPGAPAAGAAQLSGLPLPLSGAATGAAAGTAGSTSSFLAALQAHRQSNKERTLLELQRQAQLMAQEAAAAAERSRSSAAAGPEATLATAKATRAAAPSLPQTPLGLDAQSLAQLAKSLAAGAKATPSKRKAQWPSPSALSPAAAAAAAAAAGVPHLQAPSTTPAQEASAEASASVDHWVQDLLKQHGLTEAKLQQQAEAEAAAAAAAASQAAGAAAAAGAEGDAAASGRRSRLFEGESGSGGGRGSAEVLIPEGVTARGLAQLLGVPLAELEAVLVEQLGEALRSVEDEVGLEAAELAAMEFGRVAIRVEAAGGREAVPRPAVIAILGHVDHGKTSLLDALRSTSVAASEAGGITQHIGAFEVTLPGSGHSLTFLDTPGHAAFSAMRARGAAVTDIAVLVVAADDGVMPQTQEALAHARSAGCPIVVALTKCDLPQARPDVVKQQLLSEGLELEEYGGDVMCVMTSARSGLGLSDLEEALLLQAELMELRAPLAVRAEATVVEARLDRRLGAAATVVVKRGVLRVGDPVVVGTEHGKVRALRSSSGAGLPEAGPGKHALVTGLKGLPQAGDELQVVASEARAIKVAGARAVRAEEFRRMQQAAALHAQRQREVDAFAARRARMRELKEQQMALLQQRKQHTAEKLTALRAERRALKEEVAPGAAAAAAVPAAPQAAAAAGGGSGEAAAPLPPRATVPVVVKADVAGSVEAVRTMLEGLGTEVVGVKVVYGGVGPVTSADVNLAHATGAAILAFNLGGQAGGPEVAELLKRTDVKVLSHNVIYHLMDLVRVHMEGNAPLVEVEEVVGSATVQATFPLSASGKKGAVKGGKIAGVKVSEGGSLRRDATLYRVLRNGEVVWEGPCSSLRRHKLDVEVVGPNTECGVALADGVFSDFMPGDVVQCVNRVSKRASLTAGSAGGEGAGAAEQAAGGSGVAGQSGGRQ